MAVDDEVGMNVGIKYARKSAEENSIVLNALQGWLHQSDEDRFVELVYFKSSQEWKCTMGVRGHVETFGEGRASDLCLAIGLAALNVCKILDGVAP